MNLDFSAPWLYSPSHPPPMQPPRPFRFSASIDSLPTPDCRGFEFLLRCGPPLGLRLLSGGLYLFKGQISSQIAPFTGPPIEVSFKAFSRDFVVGFSRCYYVCPKGTPFPPPVPPSFVRIRNPFPLPALFCPLFLRRTGLFSCFLCSWTLGVSLSISSNSSCFSCCD